jgi:hypothetical protein
MDKANTIALQKAKQSLLFLLSYVDSETKPKNPSDTKAETVPVPERCPTCGEDRVVFHYHHIVPRAIGGADIASNIVRLCSDCHAKIHGHQLLKTSAMVKAGIAAARERGAKWGRPVVVTPEIKGEIVALRQQGYSLRAIERHLEQKGQPISSTSIERTCAKYRLDNPAIAALYFPSRVKPATTTTT